ncbi:uncharacterized protein EDB91DRAFT_1252653 [Suillus paluster]|uniref:uncharacterized protein n=1 Tax=Suillus paluster TaxID=48578 RepID=UPI001B87E2EE|nr:uncharacterized protein EDB91DRAFT_1252653 [Suillus paluster]KAG1730392.1 hypothetical protein EDB91DRAFT_1252653 [Suillus paluster]
MASLRKLAPRWSMPRFPLNRLFHAWHLRHFISCDSTTLATLQAALRGDNDKETELNEMWSTIQEELEDMSGDEDIRNDDEDIDND